MTAHAHDHAAATRRYVQTWALLCVLLVVSIVGPMFEIRLVTLLTAFGVAIVKAAIVVRDFMHLKVEKKWVGFILLGMLAFMLVFFAGTAPDVLRSDGQQWEKTYVEPHVTGGAGEH